ncbi:MAG TPA: DUF2059 domain-containing protein [Candidatus Dormibacteraeota bacterium]|nr:DUF2059 domain-containing protein [Candidatus Dormibacteraeota bacterium]
MKFRNLVVVAGLCIAGPALAKAPPSQLPQAPAPSAHHQAAPAPKPAAAASNSNATAAAKVDPAKEAAIRHLMDITQTSKLGDNMATYIAGQVRTFMSHSMDPQTLPKFMDAFNQKFAASEPPQNITEAMVPIYDHAFTMQEIQGLVQFYQSPLGQHVVKVLPQVLEDSQNTAAKIDQEAALNVLRGMSDDYPQLKSILPGPKQPAQEGAPAQQAPPAAPQQ